MRKSSLVLFNIFVIAMFYIFSCLALIQNAFSQTLYQYKDKSGIITFTTKKPEGRKYSVVNTKSLSRSVVISGKSSNYKYKKIHKSKYDSDIRLLAKEYRLDPALIKAIIHVESSFNPYAVSPAGARGLMQLMPATAKRFGVKNSYNTFDNMHGGIQYLRWLYDRFNGNIRFMLAAYNAGEGSVDSYKGVPPYKETQNYVRSVIKMSRIYKNDFSTKAKQKDKLNLLARSRLSSNIR